MKQKILAMLILGMSGSMATYAADSKASFEGSSRIVLGISLNEYDMSEYVCDASHIQIIKENALLEAEGKCLSEGNLACDGRAWLAHSGIVSKETYYFKFGCEAKAVAWSR